MKLNFKKELPVKYIVESYRFLPGYPTGEDLLFDFINYILQSKHKNKKLSLDDFVINISDFRNIFKYDLTDEFKGILKSTLKKLKDDGFITTDENKIVIFDKAINLFYTINDKL